MLVETPITDADFDDMAVHNDERCRIELFRTSDGDGIDTIGVGCETCNEVIIELINTTPKGAPHGRGL